MNTVLFVGAGPGAEDLITVRGLRALQEADVVVYAGSLVNPALLHVCHKECVCHDSASLSLEEQVRIMREASIAGKNVVRLHTGDPSVYGAIAEQMDALAKENIQSRIIPGVSSVFGAAAALGCELTRPEISQSVVLTRTPGRTPMPESENAAAFARTGATLAFFLSTGHLDALIDTLTMQGGLASDTPAAVVYRATWPDERIVRGTLATIAARTADAGITRQALVFVGQALASEEKNADTKDSASRSTASLLYTEQFSHGYRNQLHSEQFAGSCAMYAFTRKGLSKAHDIATGLAPGIRTVIHATGTFTLDAATSSDFVRIPSEMFDVTLAENWLRYDAHLFIGATGIAVRKIAPLLCDKTSDPAVLSCTEMGDAVISLTSGHLGGANRLARRIARITGGRAIISTATDTRDCLAFDTIASEEQARILNPDAIRILNAALLEHESIAFCGPQALFERYFTQDDCVFYAENPYTIPDAVTKAVFWDSGSSIPSEARVVLQISSKVFVLGVGCRRDTSPEALRMAAATFLAEHDLHPEQLACISSCDLKADEPAILSLSESWHLPAVFHTRTDLDAVAVPNPSARVRENIGIGSVAEAAALLTAANLASQTPDIRYLHVPKTSFNHDSTFALARIPHGARTSDRRSNTKGRVLAVGIGSGSPSQITPEVRAALRHCDIVAGYGPYLDMVAELIADKPVIRNGMKAEIARCRAALEAAQSGHEVCMVCSGDPGVLAMAGLLYELRDREFQDAEIRVLPGITAASLAAARLGAPLQNGYVLVSLSDLLIPTDEVRQNIHAASETALPVVLYNPAGRKRRHLLHEALDHLLTTRGPVASAFVRHAGRPEEECWLGSLVELPRDRVDMSTVILVGGPRTRIRSGVLYEPRGYEEKYLEDAPHAD